MIKISKILSLLLLLSLIPSFALPQASLPSTIKDLRIELDIVNFDLADNDARVKRLKELIPHSEVLAENNKNDAGFQMLAGLYNAQYAGYTGGVGALKYAKAARDFLEKSAALDPILYDSTAHVVLGTLYAQVPGWPVGFGSKKKALKNYQTALELSPNSIDPNFSYASYLFSQKNYLEAKTYLEKAASAPARADRPKADQNLKKQIQKGLELIEEKLAK